MLVHGVVLIPDSCLLFAPTPVGFNSSFHEQAEKNS